MPISSSLSEAFDFKKKKNIVSNFSTQIYMDSRVSVLTVLTLYIYI